MAQPVLEVKQLQTYFFSAQGTRVVKAVDGVSFTLNEGETLGVVGESGSGKTVTSMSLLRLVPPAARIVGGEVWFQGENLLTKSEREMRELRGSQLTMILQDPMMSLNPLFTIGEQIAEPLRMHRHMRGARLVERIKELLRGVRIPSPEVRLREYPHQMSGGMRQRAMLAIALACNPELLLADEPTTALDVTVQAQILYLLRELQTRLGMAVIFVTHDLGVAAEVADEVAVMYAGRIVEYGPVRAVLQQPAHPYTQGLMNATVHRGMKGKQLVPIPGQPPDLTRLPAGCAFAPRCAFRTERCGEAPALAAVGEAHGAACWESDRLTRPAAEVTP